LNEALSYFRTLDPALQSALVLGLRVAAILAVAAASHAIASRMIRTFRAYMERRRTASEQGRIQTLGHVFRYVAGIVIWVIAASLLLNEFGLSVAPILATAGVAGVAIGFGAQSLIKDLFAGIFLLLEDQLREGDVVELSGEGGLVEEVTLRYVRLRNFEGHVIFIANGEIKTVKNLTRGYAQAVVEVGVAYREDVDEALAVMREVGQAMRADPVFGPKIDADTEIVGVERWADSAVILRCRLRVVPASEQWSVRREFLRRLKKAYDGRGIEIPYPHVTVYPGQLKDGTAPPLHVAELAAARGAHRRSP
jgi:small conductance mechanosensitive channel